MFNNTAIAAEFERKMQLYESILWDEFMMRCAMRTPVDTGRARDGYYVKHNGETWLIMNKMDYVKYLEYGTYKMAPHAMIQTTMLEMDDISKMAKQKANL